MQKNHLASCLKNKKKQKKQTAKKNPPLPPQKNKTTNVQKKSKQIKQTVDIKLHMLHLSFFFSFFKA